MWLKKKVQLFQCCSIFHCCNDVLLEVFVVGEANRNFGESLRSDLELQTTLIACAVCSELKNASELMSIVLEKKVIPELSNLTVWELLMWLLLEMVTIARCMLVPCVVAVERCI
jgi:hypothetical protein